MTSAFWSARYTSALMSWKRRMTCAPAPLARRSSAAARCSSRSAKRCASTRAGRAADGTARRCTRMRSTDDDGDEERERDAEADVGHGEHDERADEQQRAPEDVDEERDEELRDRVHVAVDALDHLAGRMLAVIPDVERQRVGGHLLAQPVRRRPCLPARDPRAHDGRALCTDGDHEVQRGDRDELARRGAPGRLVDEVADDDRSEQRQHRSERERADESHERRASGPHVGAQEPPWIHRSGVQSLSTLRPSSCAAHADYDAACVFGASGSSTTSKPSARATGIWRESNVQIRQRPRQPIGGGEMDGVDGAHRLGASEFSGAIEARLVDRNDVDAFPVVTYGAAQRVALAFEAADSFDEHEHFAQRERRCAPVVVGGHRVEHDLASRAAQVAGEERGRVQRRARQRTSATSRSSRVPTGIATSTSGAGRSPRRAFTTSPLAARSSIVGWLLARERLRAGRVAPPRVRPR